MAGAVALTHFHSLFIFLIYIVVQYKSLETRSDWRKMQQYMETRLTDLHVAGVHSHLKQKCIAFTAGVFLICLLPYLQIGESLLSYLQIGESLLLYLRQVSEFVMKIISTYYSN